MKKLIILSVLFIGAALAFYAGCSDKDSTEACLFETTMNLDKGNYDAVLKSECADPMQKGAAYFGLAGFDVKDVINRFSEAGSEDSTTTGPSQGDSDLNFFMNTLIPKVTEPVLLNLDNSEDEYNKVAPDSYHYKDAKFYISLVDTVKGLSLIKLLIQDVTGSINEGCDSNNNGVPDGVDATSCALIISSGTSTTCTVGGAVITTDTGTIGIQNKTGVYRGLITSVTGTGPQATCPAPNDYKNLLFQQGGLWIAATTTQNMCQENNPDPNRTWPCPLEQGGQPQDFVYALDSSLTTATSSLITSITGTTTDVSNSINDIKSGNCCTPPEVWDPNNPASCPCDSLEIAKYLQTI